MGRSAGGLYRSGIRAEENSSSSSSSAMADFVCEMDWAGKVLLSVTRDMEVDG